MTAYLVFGTFFLAVLVYVVMNFFKGLKKGRSSGCPMGCSNCVCNKSPLLAEIQEEQEVSNRG